MQYLCPKCGNFMVRISTASIPAYAVYRCLQCGYTSKSTKELPSYITLPRELWSHGEKENNECDN